MQYLLARSLVVVTLIHFGDSNSLYPLKTLDILSLGALIEATTKPVLDKLYTY